MKKWFALLALCCLPSLAAAATFANDPIFLSRSPVTEGMSVRVYAILQENDSDNFTGTVVMSDNGTSIGSTSVSVASGATQTISVKWSPTAGSHTITAQLINPTGILVQTQTSNFVVLAPPQPTTTPSGNSSAAAVQSSAGIQQQINSYSPQAAAVSQPILSTIDSLRSDAANGLTSQLASAQTKLASSPNPTAQTSQGGFSVPNTTSDFWWVLWTGYSWLLQALLYIVGNVALFYPLFVLAVFYLLFKTYRWARRPSY